MDYCYNLGDFPEKGMRTFKLSRTKLLLRNTRTEFFSRWMKLYNPLLLLNYYNGDST